VRTLVTSGATEIPVKVGNRTFMTLLEVSDRQRLELAEGGTLNYVRSAETRS